eukprot:scaffold1148_cov335-Pavlova_lutheri.AAC.2
MIRCACPVVCYEQSSVLELVKTGSRILGGTQLRQRTRKANTTGLDAAKKREGARANAGARCDI